MLLDQAFVICIQYSVFDREQNTNEKDSTDCYGEGFVEEGRTLNGFYDQGLVWTRKSSLLRVERQVGMPIMPTTCR